MGARASEKAAMKSAQSQAEETLGVVTLAQRVTDQLREALIKGQFVANEKLQEESLSAMLNVSRTPVRSALHSLANEGLLDYVPNRGYNVRRIDAGRLTSSFDVRGVLEGLAARLAAEHGMDETQQARYRAALAEGDRIVQKGKLFATDRKRFSDVNARLHDAVFQAADNPMLIDMIRMCHNIPIASDRNVLWHDYAWLRRSHDDHHRLYEAITMRDGARAEQLMREHVLTVKLQMKSQLEHKGEKAPGGPPHTAESAVGDGTR
jgi:GntR family transcriptional regulator of vanillate catabolism